MANSFADQVRAGDRHGWRVYVLSERGEEFCKIGSALTVSYRIQSLRNGNPRPLLLVAEWVFASRQQARMVESRALINAGPLRIQGRDWLECSSTIAVDLIENAISELGLVPNPVKR